MHRPHKYIGVTLCVFTFVFTMQAHAQSLGTEADPLRMLVSPEVPGPNTSVRMEVQGIGTFLGNATITWRQNGAVVKTGVGERVYSLTTGALGSVTRVSVTVNSATEGLLTREQTFIPSAINLVWEADTYTPPLYRGKALYTPGAQVTVTAFPQVVANGRTISANNLSFQWERNGNPAPQLSGQGRSTFTFTGNQLRTSESVGVDVYFGGALVGRGSITISAVTPRIVLYPRDPLRGILYDQALPSAISLTSREITLQAEPFFFSRSSLANGSLTYQWELNNRSTTGPDAGRGILTLRKTGEGTGSAVIGVELQNTDGTKILQAAEAAVRIIFGQTTGGFGSFFGL